MSSRSFVQSALGRAIRGAIAGAGALLVLSGFVGFAEAATASTTSRLVYHGGPVLTHPSRTYLVYWRGATGTLPRNYVPDLAAFINDWSGSPAHDVLAQYYQHAGGTEYVSNSVSLAAILTDTNPFPRRVLTDGELKAELRRLVEQQHLPEGYLVNYAVVLPQQEQASGPCAWHDWVADSTRPGKIFYSIIPYFRDSAVCPMPGGLYPHGQDIDNAIDRLSHELAEIATDPWHSHAAPDTARSWYTDARQLSAEEEIGDLCRVNGHGVYGPRNRSTGADVVLHGHPYLIQGEWSDAENRCSLGDTPLARNATLGSPFLAHELNGEGLGTSHPRTFQGGGFPIYDKLKWTSWGAPTAEASGYDLPDGPGQATPVRIRADDLGACDGAQLVYRRVRVSSYYGHRWHAWMTYDPIPIGSEGFGILCVDTAVHQCTFTDANGNSITLTAYNLPCVTARSYWNGPLPPGWTGANGDDSRGGHVWLYRQADINTISVAAQPDGELNWPQLSGLPAVYAMVPYGT